MEEIWRDIKGYDGLYMVSDWGRVKSLDRIVKGKFGNNVAIKGKVLKPKLTWKGYHEVHLCKERTSSHRKVHRLVLEAFSTNPENKPQVNHLDGIKTNNTLDNLVWATQSENMKHSWDKGLFISTENHKEAGRRNLAEWRSKKALTD